MVDLLIQYDGLVDIIKICILRVTGETKIEIKISDGPIRASAAIDTRGKE